MKYCEKKKRVVLIGNAKQEYTELNKLIGAEHSNGITSSDHQILFKAITQKIELLRSNPQYGINIPKDTQQDTGGCPVICTMNPPLKGICNGDTGILIDKKEDISTVEFIINGQHKMAEFTEEEQLDLSPAYAITIHKSQGSGFDNVIVFYGACAENKEHVNNRNSLYTAITRAKESVTVFFEDEGTKKMCYEVEL